MPILIFSPGIHTVGIHTVGIHAVGIHTIGIHTAGIHTVGIHTVIRNRKKQKHAIGELKKYQQFFIKSGFWLKYVKVRSWKSKFPIISF